MRLGEYYQDQGYVFTQDTGYRLYEWDGNVFLGYTTPGQPAGPLSFLVQLESTPH